MSKDNTEHIKSIENISYKDLEKLYQLRGEGKISYKQQIYYTMCFIGERYPDRPSPNKYLSPSFVGKYNELLQLIPMSLV